MDLSINNTISPAFRGRREDRNTVKQLSNNNNYSLTENNKIRINKAIDNLSKEKGENNIKFLLEVADGLQYGTNINLGKEPENNWKQKLHRAAEQSLMSSNPIVQKKYSPQIKKVFCEPKDLSEDEKDILKSRKNILSQLDMKQLENEKNPNIKNIQSNLDYFIASSDTPTKQKKYILNRLDYFLSPEYKINPQLKDKKTLAFAEIINDIVVDTKESKVPNTKAINQKHHGMCAAISIARKLTSYEYKPQYVDAVMSELDDSDKIMVYDKTRLGQGIKVPVEKCYVDFDEASNKGYRIVDASTTHWMHIADSYNGKNESDYVAFDAENFGASSDNHFLKPIEDSDYTDKHRYYQGLLLSKEAVGKVKAQKLRKNLKYFKNMQSMNSDMSHLQKINSQIKTELETVVPDISKKEVHKTFTKLLTLQSKTSLDIDKIKDGSAKYHFMPNEETVMKDKKVKSFISDSFKNRVDNKKLEEHVSEIRSLTEDAVSIQDMLKATSSQGAKISKARGLYEAAAAYRNANLIALNDKDYKTDKMIKYNVSDEETIVLENLDKTIKYIDKTGDKRYINHFSSIYGTEPTKEATIEILNVAKESVGASVTSYLDEAYRALGMGSRKDALKTEVLGMKDAMMSGDNDIVKSSAFSLGLKKDDKAKVLKTYDKFAIELDNPTEKQYNAIFNKLGYKNQLQAFADSFAIVNDALNNPENPANAEIVENFNSANGIDSSENIQGSKEVLRKIGEDFNKISQNYSFIRASLEIADDSGKVLNSAHPHEFIISAMEKEGEIISAKELMPLKRRFDNIDKLRSQDEFSSRQGKISDPSLYRLSKPEKSTLKKIDKSINKMYSSTNKELAFVLSDIRKPLEEHVRKTGVAKGSFWNTQTGSGLYDEQEIKILEMITDNKYRSVRNLEKAVEKIKNTEHSGVSGSSVFHNRAGGHAQYVAEVSPINNKDVLYHDNSWGASENENVWIDSKGVRHTDYSDERGGETGYITNDKYRNGNYVEDLLYKPGYIQPKHIENKQLRKLSEKETEHKFQMLYNTLIPGNDGDIKDLAISMKYNIFQPNNSYVGTLKDYAGKMSQEEIKSTILRNKTAGENYKNIIKKIDNSLDTNAYHKGIETEAEYNALKDDSPIKVVFEKAALLKSFPDAADWKDLAKAKTVQEVNVFKNKRRDRAKKYFDYAFAKDPKILYAYVTNPKVNNIVNIIDNATTNHNIKLNEKQKTAIISNVAVFSGKNEKSQFDGSLRNTINFMVGKTLKQFDDVVPDSEDARLAKQEIKENLTDSISNALYFNGTDIDNKSTKFMAIAKYIDKKYNPETNEDFVNVYKNLQDMTTDEFNKETSDVADNDLAIKEYSGYEMLKRYTAADSKTDSLVKNVVYQQELLNDISLSQTTPVYKYNKLYKKNDGAIYKNGRTLDDLYRDFSSSVSRLDYEKLFNKNKDSGLREYNAMPSYPKLEFFGEQALNQKQDSVESFVKENSEQIKAKKDTLDTYKIMNRLVAMVDKLPEDKPVSKKQSDKIRVLSGQFVSDSYDDNSLKKSVDSAFMLINLDNGSTGKDYKVAADALKTQFNTLQTFNSKESLEKSIIEDSNLMKNTLKVLIRSDINRKYQDKLFEDANNWVDAVAKLDTNEIDVVSKIDKFSEKINKFALQKKGFKYTKDNYIDNLITDTLVLKQTNFALQSIENDADKEQIKNNISKQIDKINKSTQTFVSGNIQPQYQQAVSSSVNDIVKHTLKIPNRLKAENEAEIAKEKFFEDYKKYNYLNYPEDLLNDFLLINAKDAKDNCPDAQFIGTVRQGLETNFQSVLSVSSLLEMQEYLMDAVGSGNAEQIPAEFKNVETPLQDSQTGAMLNMDNYKAIDYIVKSLMTTEDDSTAVMFINKLGFADKFIRAQNEILDFNTAKKGVDKTVRILGITARQADIVQKEVEKISGDEMESCENYSEKIEETKQNIINKTKNMNRKSAIKVYLKALDDVNKIISANPGLPRNSVLAQFISQANATVGDMANSDLTKIQSEVKYLDMMYNLINKLDIPEYSPAIQEREIFNKKYIDFETYNNSVLTNQLSKSSNSMSITLMNE